MAWTQVTLHNGSTVDLYLQAFAQECGPSSVATIGRLMGKNLDIGPARIKVGSVDHNRPPGAAFGGGGHDWQQDWSYMTSLTQALSAYGVRMSHTRKRLTPGVYKKFVEDARQNRPRILRVAWQDGSGHFVVTVGRNGADQQSFVEILDPAYGYQRVSLVDFPTYSPRDPVTRVVTARGTLDRFWSVETN